METLFTLRFKNILKNGIFNRKLPSENLKKRMATFCIMKITLFSRVLVYGNQLVRFIMVILQWMIGMTMRTGHIRFRIQVRYDTKLYHHRRRLKAYHNHLVNHLHLHQPPPCNSNKGVVTLWRCLWKQELDHF